MSTRREPIFADVSAAAAAAPAFNASSAGGALAPAAPVASVAPATLRARLLSNPIGRVLRNAAIGIALLCAIPFAMIGNRSVSITTDFGRVSAQLAQIEKLRALRAPIDESITPQMAGAAFRRLSTRKQGAKTDPRFALRPEAVIHDRPWQNIELSADMFPTMRTPQFKGPANFMVIALTANGYNAKELDYLRTVAQAPIWKDFDAVARARNVDMIGGLYTMPFADDASLNSYPIINFSDSKELAFAATSRAAYHVATGNTAEAERVLQSVVSFGFMLVDQGNGVVDAMLGRIIVDIARDGLWHLYALTGRNEEIMLVDKFEPVLKAIAPAQRDPRDVAADPLVPRPLRIEALRSLTAQSCGSVRGTISGPDAATRRTFAAARAELARYPSEQAFFDVIERALRDGPDLGNDRGAFGSPSIGLAQIASAVTGNARIANCAIVAQSVR